MSAPPASDEAERLAAALVRHVQSAGVVDTELLRRDPAAALSCDPTVEVVWIDPSNLPPGCSVAAGYDRSADPARLLVALDASEGRRKFSLLHEFAHHLRDQVLEVLEALFGAAGAGERLEERVCDEFAAQVLLPRAAVAAVLAEGVTARSVLSLMQSGAASAQACAVAAARLLPAPGYVMLLNPAGEATFAARARDVLPIARGTVQDGPLARAAASGLALRDRVRVTYGTGNRGPEMFCDTASNGRVHVAVLVADSPPWGGLTIGRAPHEAPAEQWCEDCSSAFVSYARACKDCGARACVDCGRCECSAAARGERPCATCFQTLAPAAFSSAAAAVCSGCE